MKDYYAILEVPTTASQDAIREQYLLLIQAWHPDKFPNPAQRAKAEEKCKEINIAYDVLKDARKRARYDRDTRAQSSGFGQAEKREGTDERRPRKPAEAARPRPADEPSQRTERSEAEPRETEAERRAREEDWIRIYFEAARRRASRQPAPARTARAPIRVLIADDSSEARVQLHSLLDREGDIRLVGEVPNGFQAVRQFDALMPDVTIIGISVPDQDALAATGAILRKHPMAKIVILSVPSFHGFIRRAAMAGACDYLLKPPSIDELQLSIRLAARRSATTA